ncbi:MAG: MFS transporter, partial [Thermoplasmata archaeon]
MEKTEYDLSFKFLLVSRAVRSSALIFIALSLPLYLLILKVDIVNIGIIYLGTSLFNVVITISLGMLGDRIGYKAAMLMGELPPIFTASVLSITHNVALIFAATAISGVAGAPGGMRGTFSVGTTPYISRIWKNQTERIGKMAAITLTGSLFSIFGSLMLYSHVFLIRMYGNLGAFLILYRIALILMLISFISIAILKRDEKQKKSTRFLKKESMKYSARIIIANVINGSAIGFSMSLISAWFEIRYHVSVSSIGLMFTFSYVTTALGSFVASRAKVQHGMAVKYGAITRVLQGTSLILLALMPFYSAASAVYIARTFIAGFGTPIRSSVGIQG